MSVHGCGDHVRQPTRRTGSIVLGGSGGMVRMAVVDPDEIEVFLSHIVVDPEELKRIDHVSPRPVLRRDVPGPARFHDAPRSTRMADEKTAAFLRVRLARMILNRLKDLLRDLDRLGVVSYYRSARS